MSTTTKKPSTLDQVLKKMKLSEDEGYLFFQHFAKRYLNEQCYLEIAIDSSINYEEDSKYATIGIQATINAQGENLLTSHSDCVIKLN